MEKLQKDLEIDEKITSRAGKAFFTKSHPGFETCKFTFGGYMQEYLFLYFEQPFVFYDIFSLIWFYVNASVYK